MPGMSSTANGVPAAIGVLVPQASPTVIDVPVLATTVRKKSAPVPVASRIVAPTSELVVGGVAPAGSVKVIVVRSSSIVATVASGTPLPAEL